MSAARVAGPARARRAGREYLPSPQEIREACRKIQAGWSAHERAQRWTGPRRQHWEFPLVAARDLFSGDDDEERD
jgi:hypothetical protein